MGQLHGDIAIVGDGRRILAATDSGAVKVIDIACGEEMESLQGHSDRVTALGVTPDGSRAVSASRDGTIRVWDLATGREIAHFRGEDSFEAARLRQTADTSWLVKSREGFTSSV